MRILLSISIILIGFCSFAGVVVLDQNGQGDYTTFADAFTNSTAGDTIYVVGSANSYGNISISSNRTVIGNGYFGQALGYHPSSTFGNITVASGGANSTFIGVVGGLITLQDSNVSFIGCQLTITSTIGASITNVSYEKCYFTGPLTIQGSGVSITNSIFNYTGSGNVLTITGGVETVLTNNTFYDGIISLDTAIVSNCIVNTTKISQVLEIIIDGEFGNKVDTEAALLFSTDEFGDRFFQLQPGSPALTSSEEAAESGAFGFPIGQDEFAYALSGLPSIPVITGLSFATATNASTNLDVSVQASSDLSINQISVSIFKDNSEVDVQNFNGFSPLPDIDEVITLTTETLEVGMHNFSVEVVNVNGTRSIHASGSFLLEEALVSNANITNIEYFFDTDPGTGSGTQVDVSSSTEISIPIQSLNTSGLSEGFHNLYLRAKDETGKWGGYQSQSIYIESPIGVGDVVVIDQLEYFIDTDPGVGLGTPITGSGSDVSLVESLDLSTLAVGFHTVYLRGKLINGSWGPYSSTIVYIESTVGLGDVVVINELEYFIDTDPGAGLGTPITISEDVEVSIPMESLNTIGLSAGFHTLYLRGKLINGAWGPYTSQSIYVETGTQGTSEQIVALEYFFDEDPGVGAALVASGSTPALTLNENVSLDASGLSAGTHTVSFRAKEESGLWSHYQTQAIEVLSGALVESISDGNWSDPGIWSLSTVPSGIDSVVIQNVVALNVASDTVLALTLAPSGTFDLGGNDVHVKGRFTSQVGSTYTPNNGSLFMDGGSQTYSQEGDITHDNLIFGGTGTKVIDYLISDILTVSDSLHIASGVSLSFSESNALSLTNTADFVNEGTISSTDKWSLFVNGTSHIIDGGDFDGITIEGLTTLNITSDLNYESDFNAETFGSTINIGSNEINLGETWNIASSEEFNYDIGGRFQVEKSIVFSMELEVPITIVDANAGTFSANGDLTFGADQLLNIETGTVNLNGASFSGSGGISLTGGALNVANSILEFGTGSFLTNDGGNMSITGTSSISGATTADTYTFLNNSGSLSLDGTSVSEVGGLGLTLVGGTASLANVTFMNGLGLSYITFDEGFDGTSYEGIFFEDGPTFNVSINDGVVANITFDQYGGSFGGPDFDNPGTTGTINWTNPQGAGTITVNAPAGTEELNVGDVFEITWTTENIPGSDLVEINLSTDGGGSYTLINDGTFDTYNGSFDWTVPDEVGSENVIQILNTTQGISDESEGFFSIVQPGGTPVANAALNITSTSFTANWTNVGGDSYTVDVSTLADFSTFVAGKEGLNSTGTSLEIEDLDFSQTYFYRVSADQQGTQTDFSESIKVKTAIDVETMADSSVLVQIYNSLGGSSWSTAVNWETARLRNWDRVNLNTSRTRVEAVDISGVGSFGDMPNPFTEDAIGGLSAMLEMNVSNNQITGLMDFAETIITNLNVSGNSLEFDDLEPVASVATVDYSNQASVQFLEASTQATKVRYTNNYNLSTMIGGSSNEYQWFRNESTEALSTNTGFTVNGDNLDVVSIDFNNMGSFRAEVTSTLVPNLTINVDAQQVLAIANMTVEVRNDEGVLLPETLDGYLMETTRLPRGFDTLEIKRNQASTFVFQDVVLGNYLMAAESDPAKYIPTYFGDVVEWNKGDTVLFRTDEAIQLQMVAVPPVFGPGSGDGTLDILIEEDFGEGGGRIDARRRAARRKCGLRRKTGGGRTEVDEDGFELVAYGETDDNGEFQFGFLPQGTYRFFVEYPGIPLDDASFVEFVVGEAGISNTDFKLEAFASEDGLEVTIEVVLGIIFDYFKDLQVYPNPSSEVLNISYRHLTTDAVRVELVDLTGAVLYQQDLQRGYDRDIALNVRPYEKGIYILRFYDTESSEENMISYRILIQD